MKTKRIFVLALSLLAAALSATHYAASPVVILNQTPEYYLAKEGDRVKFRVTGVGQNCEWYWGSDTNPVSTTAELEITATQTNIGEYTAHFTRSNSDDAPDSRTVFLSVYRLDTNTVTIKGKNRTVVNAGTLTVAVGSFSGCSYSCNNQTFTAGYSLAGSGSTPYLFYGPNVPAGSQSGPFANPGLPNLKIWTATGRGVTSGTRLQDNKVPPLTRCCTVTNTTAEYCTIAPLSTGLTAGTASYRGIIYHNGAATGSIQFHWLYY